MVRRSTELARWNYLADANVVAPVLPDGCRDIIVEKEPGKAPVLFVSSLAQGVEWHGIHAGVSMHGVRLPAGAKVDERGLQARWTRRPIEVLDDALIAEHVHFDPRIQESLAGLAAHANKKTAVAAEALGVSLRTLQRLFSRNELPAPDFWRRLVRVRRAGRALLWENARISLAQVAADHGYADQAHLSREVRRWFGVTPGELRRAPSLANVLAAVGYD